MTSSNLPASPPYPLSSDLTRIAGQASHGHPENSHRAESDAKHSPDWAMKGERGGKICRSRSKNRHYWTAVWQLVLFSGALTAHPRVNHLRLPHHPGSDRDLQRSDGLLPLCQQRHLYGIRLEKTGGQKKTNPIVRFLSLNGWRPAGIKWFEATFFLSWLQTTTRIPQGEPDSLLCQSAFDNQVLFRCLPQSGHGIPEEMHQ